jgi:hypothetical protein
LSLAPDSARSTNRGGIFLHAGDDVAVQVERDPDLAMSEPFAGDLGMYAVGEQMGCMGVANARWPSLFFFTAGAAVSTKDPTKRIE